VPKIRRLQNARRGASGLKIDSEGPSKRAIVGTAEFFSGLLGRLLNEYGDGRGGGPGVYSSTRIVRGVRSGYDSIRGGDESIEWI